MPSPGPSTSLPSLVHQQSDDTSSGVDGFSLISADPESSEDSFLDLDTTDNMALSLGNDQSASENHQLLTPTVVDWVEEQSLHDQTSSNATGPQRARVGSVSPHTSQAKQAHTRTDEHASGQECGHQAKKVYDIPTLLKLRETQRAKPVMLRIKPEAIAENIFQYMGVATSRRLSARSRGLSDISNVSTGKAESQTHTTYPVARPRYMAQPTRQPHAPPRDSLLQRHDGFVRFLKQHASPPHQRVTAGGRIVPAGPSSPPPMLDFGSLNGLLRDRPSTAKLSQESHSSQSNTRVQKPQATSSMTLGDYLRSQSENANSISVQHATQFPPITTAAPFTSMPLGCQTLMTPAVQTQNTLVPLAMFPDSSTLVSYNGVNYRASWNGANTSLEPLQPLQLPVDQQYYPQAYTQAYLDNSQYGITPQPSHVSVPSGPLASATNYARLDTAKADLFFPSEAQNNDEVSLKAKLTKLDEHLALHHYDITPVDRASLIAQRIYLVAELDRIRLSKTRPKHKIPIVAPAAPGLPVTPATQLSSDAKNSRVSKGGTISKRLSPAAPAFVPRSALDPSAISFGMRTTSQQSKRQESGITAASTEIETASRAKDNVKHSSWASHSYNKVPPPNAQRKPHNEASSSSSILDPSDPAMRVIEYEDIEYAARYLYNWTKDNKTYCTTVPEFQEAIRRVREQARLYGCAGGQSKDPAYDAEQDLWWAICDRDPIPLPSKVPDHITNPRPWNWNDSAFNYRRQGARDAPGPECEQARNSPRVLGWDPATTDKMKDVIDVSRSYFALKGRLPSVSFRGFTYDRDGNKRLIQSDTAASTAYAAATKNTTCGNGSSMVGSQWNGSSSIFDPSAPKEMSTSELDDIQLPGLEPKAQIKPINKEKAHEMESLPLRAPRTPENRRTQQSSEAGGTVHLNSYQSKANVSTGRRIIKPKDTVTNKGPHHAFVEDHPETPVAGGSHSTPKKALDALIKSPPPDLLPDPLMMDSMIAHKGSPVQEVVLKDVGPTGSRWKPTEEELSSIWYHTPLDEVTQKYVDDMKAYNPLKTKRFCGGNLDVDVARAHHQISNTSEPVAESKSPWGPEECAAPTIPSGRNYFKSPENYRRVEERVPAKTAKVNIPSASPLRAPVTRDNGKTQGLMGFDGQNTLESREFNAVNVPNIENTESHNFLRKMLKSPRYSSAQPTNIFSQISSTLADKIIGTKRAQPNSSTRQSENKGNVVSHKFGNTGVITNESHPNQRLPNSASLATVAPNIAVGKAQSSLASSTYQAHAHLPQFEGAGKAHTSSVFREQGIQPLPQVRLPSEDSYTDRQHPAEASFIYVQNPSARTASTIYHNPVNFGYDGGRDSPPPKATVNSKDQHSTVPEFDLMGVTLADYENHRGDTNNAWHHGAVDDFFQDLHERELEAIASHQRVNTQSAA